MPLTYGGLELKILSVREYTRRPLMHFHTYIYTRHILKVRAVFNPAATSYLRVPGANQPRPGAAAGMWTDAAIKHFFMTPRRQLIYTQDSIIPPDVAPAPILISPAAKAVPPVDGSSPYYSVDASIGPLPLEFRIVKRHGDKTLEVDWAVQTDLNECDFYSGSLNNVPVILSNVWKMTRDTDQDHFSKVMIEGEAVLRSDLLVAAGGKADDFVGYLSFPVPENFQRVGVQTYPSEDGTRVAYRIIDQEKPFNLKEFQNVGVTRVEAYLNAGAHAPGYELRTILDVISAIFGRGRGGISGSLSSVLLPDSFVKLVVRVWGNRTSTRKNLLETVARAIAKQLLPQSDPANKKFYNDVNVEFTEDVMGKFLEYKVEQISGPINLIDRFDSDANIKGVTDIRDLLAKKEDIPEVTTSLPFDNPYPPNDSKMRGTFVGGLVSQVLLAACPTIPPAPSYQHFKTRTVFGGDVTQ